MYRHHNTVLASLLALTALSVVTATYASPLTPAKASVSGELTLFPQTGAQGQGRTTASLAAEGTWQGDWPDSSVQWTLTPFARWASWNSQDTARSHADLRVAELTGSRGDWHWQAGVSQIYWGVTEGNHPVDVINQVDALENPEGTVHLGQPVLGAGWEKASATNGSQLLDLYLLPGFRERAFASESGRLRLPWRVLTDSAQYESAKGRHHVDVAARYQWQGEGLRVGLSAFQGTSREPQLLPQIDWSQIGPSGFAPGYAPYLLPYYPQIRQVGVDAQWTRGDWLWKAEAMNRQGFGASAYQTLDAGVEMTQVGIFGSRMDLGWLAEGLYDSRGQQATQPFEHDLLIGWRLALNDEASSELLLAVIRDVKHPESYWRLQGSHRLTEHVSLSVEGRVFHSRTPQSALEVLQAPDHDYLLRAFSRDSQLRAVLSWFY